MSKLLVTASIKSIMVSCLVDFAHLGSVLHKIADSTSLKSKDSTLGLRDVACLPTDII